MIRVILADDHRIVREGVRRIIEAQPGIHIVNEASRGEEVVEMLGQIECDVLVTDLAMPGLHGRELVERIRDKHPKLGIVVFTMYPEDPFALYFLRCGVNAFVTKEREPADLVEAIRLAAQGKCFIPERMGSTPRPMTPNDFSASLPSLSPNVTLDERARSEQASADKPLLSVGPVRIDMTTGNVQHPSGDVLLSVHELALLAYLTKRPRQTISRDELLREVWGYGPRTQTRTVEMTISRLRRKIEIDAVNPRFILTIHGEGYRFELDRPAA